MTKYFTALLLVISVMSCAQSGVGVYKPPVGNASLPAGVTSCGNALPAEDDQAVTYDADLNCAKWKTVTGEGGALDFNVKEVDNNPSVDTVSSLAFDQADGFAVSNLGEGAVRVDLVLTDAHIPNDVTIDSATSAGTADTALDLECTNCVEDGMLASTFSKFSFSTIDTPSGTDPVADSATDTLALTASGGLSITGNSTNDSIAFGLTLTDAEIPNDITIDNATTADALSNNPPPCDAGDFVTDMAADGTLTCDTPAGGGGGSVTVQESDGTPSVSDASTISFNQAQGFTVSDEGSGEAEVGLALDAAQITYADNDDAYPTDNVGAAIEALRDANGIGPNQTTGKLNWQQVMNMPEAFADGEIAAAEVPYTDAGYPAVTTVDGALDAIVNEPVDGPNSEDSIIPFENLKNVPPFRKTLFQFRPQANEPPASSFATLFARNGHPGLSFDGNVCAIWSFVMPNTYGGNGVTVEIWTVSSATSGDLDWDGSWERIETTQDIDSDSFATAVSADNNNNNATSGIPTKVSIAFTEGAQMDSCASGELCRFRLCRDDTSDTTAATNGAAVLIGGDVRETP